MKRLIPLLVVLAAPATLHSQTNDGQPDAQARAAPSMPPTAAVDATPKEASPKEAAPQEAVPKEAVPKDAVPKDAVADKQSPDEELFASKCASCHSVGKGDRVGPDLKGAHQRRERAWLLQMVKSPNSLLDSDPVARELLKKYKNVRMPDLGIADDQAALLVDLIARCSTQTCNLAGVFVPVTKTTADDVETGRKIFIGETALAGDGPPCVSCHSAAGMHSVVAGGTLAKDLSHVFARLGDEGLDAALRNPTFPLMKDIYSRHAISKEEALSLRAFFSSSNRTEQLSDDSYSLLFASVLAALLCLVALNALWSRRMRAVRKPLTQRKGVSP